MRISDILLFSLILLTACGTYDGVTYRRKGLRWLYAALLLALLLLRNACVENAQLSLYAPSLLLPILLLVRMRRDEWGGVLIVSVFGGMLAWKLSTSYPLFPEQGLLQSVVSISLACIYCHRVQAKLFAAASAAIFSGLFLFVQDVLLFGFGRISLGSPELFDAQVISVYCLLNVQWLAGLSKRKQSRPQMTAGAQRTA